MANTRNPLHVSPLTDPDQIRYWEFWCQVSFRSVDLHIKRAWSLASEEQEKRFSTYADSLEGPIIYSLLSADEVLGPGEKWKDALREQELFVNWRGVEFPVGTVPRPVRGESHVYLLCRVALGRTSSQKSGAARFPEGFSSSLVSTSGPQDPDASPGGGALGSGWWQTYLIKNGEQILPSALCDIVFEPTRISTTTLLCDMCERRTAVVYCKNDNAHFCAGCDAEHHTENEFFARHQRFPLSHSPLQFGFCKYHPSERYESVCLECKKALCPHCLVIGPHADQDHTGHTIMSTIDAFRQAMERTSSSCRSLEGRRVALRQQLYERHMQLTDVHASFEEAQQQMDVALRGVLEQLARAQSRRVEFLQSVKRQVLSQMLFLQWLENFQAHARLALPSADYLVSARRHEHLIAALFPDRPGKGREGAGEIGPMPPWMDEDLAVDGGLTVWLISAPAAEPEQEPQKEALPTDTLMGGASALERGVFLEQISGPPGGGVGLAPNVLPSGPGLFDSAVAPTGLLGFSDEGTGYLEAAPRSRPGGGYPSMPSETAMGVGGASDTLYARSARGGTVDPTGFPGSPVRPGVSPGRTAGEFDSFISSALAYLDNAESRIMDGAAQRVRAGASGGALAAPAVGGTGAGAGAGGGGMRGQASLQLATETLVELRAGGESYGGPSGQWGCILTLVQSCPGAERNELMLKALTCAAPFGDASAQLARRIVEDDVRRAQFPSLLASAHGLHAALVHAMLRLVGRQGFLDPELSVLVREVKSIAPRLDPAAVSVAMHRAVGDFIATLSRLARSGEGKLPQCLQVLCHFLYAAAEEKFGILAAQNAVATLLVSRVITPSLLRVAQRRDADVGGPGLNDRVSMLSRMLQRIAHFAHHDEEGSQRGQVVEDAVLRHIGALRELVSRLLVLPSFPSLGLEVSAEDAEAAASWIVSASRRWAAGLDSGGGFEAGRTPQQVAAASKRLAQLGGPGFTGHPSGIEGDLDAAAARALMLRGGIKEALSMFGDVGPGDSGGGGIL